VLAPDCLFSADKGGGSGGSPWNFGMTDATADGEALASEVSAEGRCSASPRDDELVVREHLFYDNRPQSIQYDHG
jgi:hypothetical protein